MFTNLFSNPYPSAAVLLDLLAAQAQQARRTEFCHIASDALDHLEHSRIVYAFPDGSVFHIRVVDALATVSQKIGGDEIASGAVLEQQLKPALAESPEYLEDVIAALDMNDIYKLAILVHLETPGALLLQLFDAEDATRYLAVPEQFSTKQ